MLKIILDTPIQQTLAVQEEKQGMFSFYSDSLNIEHRVPITFENTPRRGFSICPMCLQAGATNFSFCFRLRLVAQKRPGRENELMQRNIELRLSFCAILSVFI